MKYQVTIREIPVASVYYSEAKVKEFWDMVSLIPELGGECLKLNRDKVC